MKFDDLVKSILDEGIAAGIKSGNIQAPNNPHYNNLRAAGEQERKQAEQSDLISQGEETGRNEMLGQREVMLQEINRLLELYGANLDQDPEIQRLLAIGDTGSKQRALAVKQRKMDQYREELLSSYLP